jgi:hypothetical protein
MSRIKNRKPQNLSKDQLQNLYNFHHGTTPEVRLTALTRMTKATLIDICMQLRDNLDEKDLEVGDTERAKKGFAERARRLAQDKNLRRKKQTKPISEFNWNKTRLARVWHTFVDNHIGDADVKQFKFKSDCARHLIRMMKEERVSFIPGVPAIRRYFRKRGST